MANTSATDDASHPTGQTTSHHPDTMREGSSALPEPSTLPTTLDIPSPYCDRMTERPSAAYERDRLRQGLLSPSESLLVTHLSYGLAYTVGSAIGSTPPSLETCLQAFTVPNKAGLTAGARAWSKHAHRSGGLDAEEGSGEGGGIGKESLGWWGVPSGPVAGINEKALALFWKVMNGATWHNLHWLPHTVLVYEVRVPEGYGMRWSQDRSVSAAGSEQLVDEDVEKSLLDGRPWTFRGCVEPMMESGHERGWRH